MRVWPLTVFLLISNTMPVSHKIAWLGYQRHLSPTGVSPPFSLVRLVLPASYDSISDYINPWPRTAKVPLIFKNVKNQRPYKREQDKRMKEIRDWALSPLLQSGSWLSRFAPSLVANLTIRSCLESLRASWQSLMSQLHSVTSGIIHTHTHFVHNLYTKTRTAANRAYNLHPH